MKYLKRIYDSVHGFIYFSSLEKDLIDTYVFQRLHYLHQVGVAYLVYPGATHSRFEHSLGVMHVATQIFDQIIRKYEKPLEEDFVSYWKQIVRFGALCHDLGHLPFSHTGESLLLGKHGHEKWTMDIIESSFLTPIWESFQKQFPSQNVAEDVLKISLGEEKLLEFKPEQVFTPWEKVLSQIVSGDFFGADRIDYLLRDARSTGVSYGLFDYQQLIEMLRIFPWKDGKEECLALGIEENGLESCEALLLARHFMYRRVYQYPTVKAYSFHMARFLKEFSKNNQMLDSLSGYLKYTDNEVLAALRLACLESSNEDALALLSKKNRYHAFELPGVCKKEELEDFKNRFQLEDLEVSVVSEKKGSAFFSFPVLTKNQKIVDATSCFSISIPSHASTWIYMPPQYESFINVLFERYPLEKNNAKD